MAKLDVDAKRLADARQDAQDAGLIDALLKRDADNQNSELPVLHVREREAFTSMREAISHRALTDKQRDWLFAAASRLGVVEAAPARNVFSELSPEKQKEHLKRANRVKLPWERDAALKVLKPPGR